jgi:hypothetical protein
MLRTKAAPFLGGEPEKLYILFGDTGWSEAEREGETEKRVRFGEGERFCERVLREGFEERSSEIVRWECGCDGSP